MKNPYEDAPPSAFWRGAVAEASPFNLEGIYQKKWSIPAGAKIATAGSCFAQHISRHLRSNGRDVLDVEPAPPGLAKKLHGQFGYSTYSARFGNIYTVHQLLQLAEEAAGVRTVSDFIWNKNSRFFDALRPAVEPNGLHSPDAVQEHRAHHLSRVRDMFSSMDLFIFTLGLTEAWVAKDTKTVFPTAPGTIAGEFDDTKFEFKNYNYSEITGAFAKFREILRYMRGNKDDPLFLLTVSPVPLTATASSLHVLQATTYSKSVLRAVAGDLAQNDSKVDYFPSFEIITNQAARGIFYEGNMRSVRTEGVDSVMRTFSKEHFSNSSAEHVKISDSRSGSGYAVLSEQASKEEEIICEEALLEGFSK